MNSKRAFVYCTFDGVSNIYHGTGTQARYFMQTIAHHGRSFSAQYGLIDYHIMIPSPEKSTPGLQVDQNTLAYSLGLIESFKGRLWYIDHDDSRLFHTDKWLQLCHGAAVNISQLVDDYSSVLIVGIDAIYTKLAEALDSVLTTGQWEKITLVNSLYSTSRIPGTTHTPGREQFEVECISRVNRDDRVYAGHLGEYFSDHLVSEFGLNPSKLLPFEQALHLEAEELQPVPRTSAVNELARFDIPTDRPLVLSFGRADPIKGIPRLIESLIPLRTEIHLVLIAVPYHIDDPEIQTYRALLADSEIRSTYITSFQRELPRALCSLLETKAVVCSSLGEPVGQVPQEVGLWARNGGPVVVAPHDGGFIGQIDDAITGFYFSQGNHAEMTRAIYEAVNLPNSKRVNMCKAAHDKVVECKDYRLKLEQTFSAVWS